LMPPVSVTMQPTKLLPDADAAELDDDEDDGVVVLDDGALDELEPHAAMSKLAAAAATAVTNAVCFTVPPLGQGLPGAQASRGCPLAQTARKGKTC